MRGEQRSGGHGTASVAYSLYFRPARLPLDGPPVAEEAGVSVLTAHATTPIRHAFAVSLCSNHAWDPVTVKDSPAAPPNVERNDASFHANEPDPAIARSSISMRRRVVGGWSRSHCQIAALPQSGGSFGGSQTGVGVDKSSRADESPRSSASSQARCSASIAARSWAESTGTSSLFRRAFRRERVLSSRIPAVAGETLPACARRRDRSSEETSCELEASFVRWYSWRLRR
jgi:hypothetical protein